MNQYNAGGGGDARIVRAIIVDNKDPDKLGRVKVKFPWLDESSTGNGKFWSRVAGPFASNDAGMWFIPEIDDEVLVLLEGGRFDTAIVIASLYSKKNVYPKSGRAGDGNSDRKNTVRYIKTKSGHKLCFDDSDDTSGIYIEDKNKRKIELNTKEKKLEIKDQAGNTLLLDEEGKKIHIHDAGGNKVDLDGSGKKIKIEDANGNSVALEGGKVEIKNQGGDTITMSAGTISIDSKAMIKLGKGASSFLIKGPEFMGIFNGHTHVAPFGPTSPPVTPMTPAQLSRKVQTE